MPALLACLLTLASVGLRGRFIDDIDNAANIPSHSSAVRGKRLGKETPSVTASGYGNSDVVSLGWVMRAALHGVASIKPRPADSTAAGPGRSSSHNVAAKASTHRLAIPPPPAVASAHAESQLQQRPVPDFMRGVRGRRRARRHLAARTALGDVRGFRRAGGARDRPRVGAAAGERGPGGLIIPPVSRRSHANRRRVNKPPFRPRHAAATTESAAARLHFHRMRRHPPYITAPGYCLRFAAAILRKEYRHGRMRCARRQFERFH